MRYIVIIALMISALFAVACSEPSRENYDSFAQCLTKNNVVMYGTEWCPHCQEQKKEFGDSFQYVNFVDCDKRSAVCADAGVSSYPTWQIGEEKYTGVQPMFRLSSLSGCSVVAQDSE